MGLDVPSQALLWKLCLSFQTPCFTTDFSLGWQPPDLHFHHTFGWPRATSCYHMSSHGVPRTPEPTLPKWNCLPFLWAPPLQATHWGFSSGTPTFYQSLQLFSSSTPRSLPRPVTSTHFRSLRQSERSRKQGPQSTWSHLRESSEQVHLWTQRAEWQTLWGGGWRIGSNCPSGLRFLLRQREGLKLDRGGACTKGHYASQAKMVNFMICESHPHLHFGFFFLFIMEMAST